MKKYILLSILAIFLVLCVSAVSAEVTIESSFDDENPTFGHDDQMASNSKADKDSDKDIYDDSEVTLKNNGTTDVTITSIDVNPESGFSQTDDNDEGYINISLDDSDLVIAASTSEPITLQARIPEVLDAVDDDGEEKAFKVARVTFNFNTGDPVSFDAYMQRKNMLKLYKVYVTSEENDEKPYDMDDYGDKVEDLKPGEEVEVQVKVENIYDSSDDDVDIDDIDVRLKIDEDEMDVDEKESLSGKLLPEESDSVTIKFTVERDADGDYNGEIYFTGDDEHGAKHGSRLELEWEVSKAAHEMKLKTASVSPGVISCGGTVSLSMKIENLGKNNEDEVAYYIKNTALGINFEKEDLEVDSDDSYSRTFSATIADSIAAGTYPIRFSVYYSGDEDDGVLGDLEDVDLVVEACHEDEEDEEEEEEEVEIIEDTTDTTGTTTAPSTSTGVVDTTETSFFDSTTYNVILVVAIIAALGAIIVLVVKFLLVKP